MPGNFSFIYINIDYIAGIQLIDITFKGKSPGIFHGIKKNRSNLAAYTDTAGSLIGNIRDIVADMPKYRISGRFS